MFARYQQTLDRDSGAINTALLLTASYFVVRAVAAIRTGRARACRDWLLAAIACGGGFLLVKTMEFAAKFDAGVTLSSNTFYFFYLSLAAFHYLHVWLGMVILLAVAWKAHRGAYSAAQHHGVESGASYWHMVDLVWLVLFPLVYLIR
jgi:nitric oxide reductase NorE protein